VGDTLECLENHMHIGLHFQEIKKGENYKNGNLKGDKKIIMSKFDYRMKSITAK
jgi:hypothetical protein